jgi:hypothetical protein
MHCLTRYDPDDGEPYGYMCDCGLGEDHNGAEYNEYLLRTVEEARASGSGD